MERWLLTGLVLPWVMALVLALWPRRQDRLAWGIGSAGALLTALAISMAMLARPAAGPLMLLDWGYGSWFLDGLSAMFLVLIAWIHVLITLFSGRYLPHAQHEAASPRREASLYALLNAFAGSMLALVCSGNLIQFYLFWELTGIASFLLIGYWHHLAKAREGALKSLVMTASGGIAMLLGFLTLDALTGGMSLPGLLESFVPESPWLPVITALIVLGALAKSAQLPFSSWLPGAMAAPTPVSAFLHSSALVAAGVYLLARFFPLLSAVPTWSWLLVPLGAIGGLLAGLMALRQTEIKALLAYSTISQYAFIFLAFGLGSVTGAQAGLYAFFVHAFIKAGLFLVAGAVTYLTDETRLAFLGGLGKSHRGLAALAVILALSLGGVPIFGGFYYKEELLYAAYEQKAWLLLASMLLGGMLTFLYMLRFLSEIFGGEAPHGEHRPLPSLMMLTIGILAAVALATGIAPNWMNAVMLNPAMASVIQAPADFRVELKLGTVLLLSLGVLAIGVALWVLWRRGRVPKRMLAHFPRQFDLGGASGLRLYGAVSERFLSLHSGNLRRYLRGQLLVGLALIFISWWGIRWGPGRVEPIDPAITLMLVISLLAATATIWLRTHVLAVIALTVSGFALAAIFALMEAPDVALAQVLVETLATFSIVMALRQSRLIHPERTEILTAGRKDWGRWGISLGIGGAMGWLAYEVGRSLPPNSAGARYAAEGYSLNKMADLVTAILADFRALDTAIEIMVFACAAFAVMGLFPRRSRE